MQKSIVVVCLSLLFSSVCLASDISEQLDSLKSVLSGKRVGLLVNPTAVDGEYRHLIDNLCDDESIRVVALFGPEHGVRGDEQAGGKVKDSVDAGTSIPVYTLYGARQSPTSEQLDMLDVLVFDIQDVGARFYTYGWTMTKAMEACAAVKKEFVVFDRPNPVGADRVEGCPLTFDCGLIGRYWAGSEVSVATRHGLTMGELATLVNEEFMNPKVRLTVVKMPHYYREMSFEESGYPWVAPSPNMPSIECAQVYLGTCIFEGINISEGRGTTKPFEWTGAPWVNAEELAKLMNGKNLPGVRFRPVSFKPTFSKYRDEQCFGVQVHVMDRAKFRGVETGYHLLKGYMELYPDKVKTVSKNNDWCGRLMGQKNLFDRLSSSSVSALTDEWRDDLAVSHRLRSRHLLYGSKPSSSEQ